MRPWSVRLDKINIVKLLPKIIICDVVKNFLDDNPDDDKFMVLYPFRTKKDKAIRRSRFPDIYMLYQAMNQLSLLGVYLTVLKSFDYIACINILRAALLFYDKHWFTTLFHYGAFVDLTSFINVSKTVSLLVKNGKDVEIFPEFIECYNLSGFRNLPFEDFDVVKESRLLAGSGQDIHDIGDVKFENMLDELFPLIPSVVIPLTFEQFVLSGKWSTAGSSSVGKAEFTTINDETFKVKCRKNLVLDVVDATELIQSCLNIKTQENTSIIKSELGKLRLAVAGDIKPYLLMSYLNYYLNSCYLLWPGNTLEETELQKLKRMENMRILTSKGYQLPFDFANFDHQPTTNEISIIIKKLTEQVMFNAPYAMIPELKKICQIVETTFPFSYLSVRQTDEMLRLPVTGGLMSGMRWTSLIGNMWNTVISSMVGLIVKNIVKNPLLDRFIQGDDSALFCRDYPSAYIYKKTYDFLKVKSASAKFSIMKGYMEFLRIQYTTKKCLAYPMRSIPSYLQAKPWTASPWNPFSSFDTLRDVTTTLIRRGVKKKVMDIQFGISCRLICARNDLPLILLNIPKALGGVGVLPWDGSTYIPHLLKLTHTKPLATLKKTTGWRAERWTQICTKFGGVPDKSKLNEQVDNEIFGIITGDEVPDIKRLLRINFKKRISGFAFQTSSLPLKHTYPNIPTFNLNLIKKVENVDQLTTLLNNYESQLFGSCPNLDVIWSELAVVARLCNLKTIDLLMTYYPLFHGSVRDKRLKHLHRSTTIDFLAGKLPSFISDINPGANYIMNKVVGFYLSQSMCDSHITLDRVSILTLTAALVNIVSDAISVSPVYNMYFQL